MKKITLLFAAMAFTSVVFAQQTIEPYTNVTVGAPVTETPAGDLKSYNRVGSVITSDGTKETNGTYTYFVFDGNTVWMKDPIGLTTMGAWIKGTRSGNKITFATGQQVSSATSSYGTSPVNVGIFTSTDGTNYELTNDDLVYTINGNKITLDNSSVNRAIGAYAVVTILFITQNSNLGLYEYGSEFTEIEPSELVLVTPPSGIASTDGVMTSIHNVDGEISTNVKTIIDGNDIYIQGMMHKIATNPWLKGTINGNTVTFPNHQYIYDNGQAYVFFGAMDDATGEFCDAIFDYDSSIQKLVARSTVGFYRGSSTQFQRYYENMVINANTAGISTTISDNNVKSVSFTDVAGRSVSTPAKGLYIKTTTFADGTKKVEKILNK